MGVAWKEKDWKMAEGKKTAEDWNNWEIPGRSEGVRVGDAEKRSLGSKTLDGAMESDCRIAFEMRIVAERS
jgi:hypothetical protein